MDGLYALVPNLIDPPGAVGAVADQPGFLEYPQVLRDGGTPDLVQSSVGRAPHDDHRRTSGER